MATPRMDVTSFVGKLLEQDDVDALCQGARPSGDGDGGLLPDRSSPVRAQLRADRLPQRLPHPTVGHQGRHDRRIQELSAELASLNARRSELAEELSESQPSVPDPAELAELVGDISSSEPRIVAGSTYDLVLPTPRFRRELLPSA